MGLRQLLEELKENGYFYIIVLSYTYGAFIFMVGLLLDPFMGNEFTTTHIKIIKINNTDIYFNFVETDNIPCNHCLQIHTTINCTNIMNNLCPIILNNVYEYYCDCLKNTCSFEKKNYYFPEAF